MKLEILAAALAIAFAADAASSSELTRDLAGAGGLGGQSGALRVVSTLGQPVVAIASGSAHTLRSGFWTRWTAGSSEAAEDASTPVRLELYPATPNPARGSVTLRYDIPVGGGAVSLRLFDIRGRRVRDLVEGPEPPGRRRLVWDGTDGGNRRVPPGVYFAVLDAGSFHRVRKLVIAR